MWICKNNLVPLFVEKDFNSLLIGSHFTLNRHRFIKTGVNMVYNVLEQTEDEFDNNVCFNVYHITSVERFNKLKKIMKEGENISEELNGIIVFPSMVESEDYSAYSDELIRRNYSFPLYVGAFPIRQDITVLPADVRVIYDVFPEGAI